MSEQLIQIPPGSQELRHIPEANPMAMLAAAVSQGASVDQLKQLMDLRDRWEATEARKAYTKAMAAFKANPPSIAKDKNVSFETSKGVTSYRHATLGNVCERIVAGLAEHDLSHRWELNQEATKVTVKCVITHALGHSESVELSGPLDSSGSKNAIQQVGSTITYLQRYTLLSATGLATMETDDDGRAARESKPVGTVSDPFAKGESVPAQTWQELYPNDWKDVPFNGEPLGHLAALADSDKVFGRMWAADRTNPALCAWAAGWILRTVKEMGDEWQDLPGVTDDFLDLSAAALWEIGAYLRKKKKAMEGGAQ